MIDITEELAAFECIELPANASVFQQGQACENYMLVMGGSVKVFSRTATGRECVLYRITSGEICILTTACVLGGNHYPAEAVTESTVQAKLIPIANFNQLIDSSISFRKFVFNNFSQRLSDLMLKFEQINTESTYYRLQQFLLQQDDHIPLTHEQLAQEIGSAREVVSRHLKQLEKLNIITLRRGLILLIDRDKLSRQKVIVK